MPLFAIHCLDKPESGALRAQTRALHLDYLAGLATRIFTAGPLLDLEGAPIGSLLIVNCADRRAAYQFAADDPYSLAGLFQSVAITAWKQVYPSESPPRA
jgi:uncharacterized protein YciI